MLRLVFVLLIFLQISVFSSTTTSGYSINSSVRPASTSAVIVRIDRRLRSAFLRRAAKPGTYAPATTPAENIAQLQRHFEAIREILDSNENLALHTALNRLERFRGESWTSSDRAEWLGRLSFQRKVQVIRLEHYRLRGLFPQNEHDATGATPVFVDNYGTDCAVGHLMRASGYGQIVDAIAKQNNLVYVTDVKSGPLVHWIAYSGLTQEEAALIQPGYTPPSADANLFDLLANDSSVSHGGIRYENFDIQVALSPFIPIDTTISIDTTRMDVAIGNEQYFDPDAGHQLDARYEDWLFFGASPFIFEDGIVSIEVLEGGSPAFVEFVYSYDVVVEASGSSLTAGSITNQPIFNFNFVNGGTFNPNLLGRIDIDTVIRTTSFGPVLASLHLDSEGPGSVDNIFFGNDSEDFAPQQAINVNTTVRLENNAVFTALTHSFQLIPEPTTLALCLVVSLSLVLRRRN